MNFPKVKISFNTHTPETAMQEIERQFQGIEAVASLKEQPGWDYIAKTIVQQVRTLERQIISLSRKPEKNSEELVNKVAERKALVGLLGLVDGLYRNKKVQFEKLEKLYNKFMEVQEQQQQEV